MWAHARDCNDPMWCDCTTAASNVVDVRPYIENPLGLMRFELHDRDIWLKLYLR